MNKVQLILIDQVKAIQNLIKLIHFIMILLQRAITQAVVMNIGIIITMQET